jgi:hypothetical protein
MIYISGKITGTDDYMERFARVEEELTAQGYAVVNPAKVNAMLPEDHMSHEMYMVTSIAMLSLCSTIYMMEGYETSAGALQELRYAVDHNLDIWKEDSNDKVRK